MMKNQFARLCPKCIVQYKAHRFGGGHAWRSRSKCTMCQDYEMTMAFMMLYYFEDLRSTTMTYSFYPFDKCGFYAVWFGSDE